MMSLKAKIAIESPGDVMATMTITMPVREWEQIRSQLECRWPASQLSAAISQLVRKSSESFSAVLETE